MVEVLLSKRLNIFSHAETDVNFSPLVVCALEKLLSSGLETFTRAEKSSISLYVCNTLKYLLQTQVNVKSITFCCNIIISYDNITHVFLD